MLILIRLVILTLPIFLGRALSGNSCRQCSGTHTLSFPNFVTEDNGLAFVEYSLGNCVTGYDYYVEKTEKRNCQTPCMSISGSPGHQCLQYAPLECKDWIFHLKIWRYCGNGGSVNLPKGHNCSPAVCADVDTLTLNCNKSVGCKGNCDCKKCGC